MCVMLHITKRASWDEAAKCGRYEADSLHTQGFIHCSTPEQVLAVANFLFRGQTDLVLLYVDARKLASEVRYENCEGGDQLFPHVYGPINLDAVTRVCDFPPNADGTFTLPK